jgi:hypothetical protein
MAMASLDDVRRLALTMPEAVENVGRDGLADWKVKDRLFVWERPLRASDLKALGNAAPDGAILGARVPDEGAKRALIAADPHIYFTTPHFDGYPAVLVRLDEIGVSDLEELVVEAWLSRAPPKLVASYLGE